jgi:hypothetical protein
MGIFNRIAVVAFLSGFFYRGEGAVRISSGSLHCRRCFLSGSFQQWRDDAHIMMAVIAFQALTFFTGY